MPTTRNADVNDAIVNERPVTGMASLARPRKDRRLDIIDKLDGTSIYGTGSAWPLGIILITSPLLDMLKFPFYFLSSVPP